VCSSIVIAHLSAELGSEAVLEFISCPIVRKRHRAECGSVYASDSELKLQKREFGSFRNRVPAQPAVDRKLMNPSPRRFDERDQSNPSSVTRRKDLVASSSNLTRQIAGCHSSAEKTTQRHVQWFFPEVTHDRRTDRRVDSLANRSERRERLAGARLHPLHDDTGLEDRPIGPVLTNLFFKDRLIQRTLGDTYRSSIYEDL